MRRALRRTARLILFVFSTCTVSLALGVGVLQAFPDLMTMMAVEKVKYYALKKNYLPDPQLVFVYRDPASWGKWVYTWPGDEYDPRYGGDAPPVTLAYSYDQNGFRPNRAGPPFDIIAVGDSYLERPRISVDPFTAPCSTSKC
jgi:hypothetical protein